MGGVGNQCPLGDNRGEGPCLLMLPVYLGCNDRTKCCAGQTVVLLRGRKSARMVGTALALHWMPGRGGVSHRHRLWIGAFIPSKVHSEPEHLRDSRLFLSLPSEFWPVCIYYLRRQANDFITVLNTALKAWRSVVFNTNPWWVFYTQICTLFS